MQSRRKEKAMARTPVIVIVACLAACSTSEPSDGTFAGADFSDASVRTAERFAKLPDRDGLLEAQTEPVADGSEVWYAPPTIWTDRGQIDEHHVFFQPGEFDRTLSAIDVYVHHVQAEQEQDASQRRQMLTVLRDHDVSLGLTVAGLRGGVCDSLVQECRDSWGNPRLDSDSPECQRFMEQVGFWSAQRDLEAIEGLRMDSERLGYEGLSVMVMDGPLKRSLYYEGGNPKFQNDCDFTVDEALEQAFSYMDTIRGQYPDMRFDWMVNFLNWDYTLADGTYMPSVRGRGNGFGQGHDARDLVNQIAGLNRGYGFDLSISSEGGAEWYEGQVWSSLWPEGAREDWYLRLLEFRAQSEGTGVAYNQGFSAVDDPCRGLDDPRALERCEVERDAWLRDLLMTHMDVYKRRAAAAGFSDSAEITTFVQWNGVPRNLIPEEDPQSFAGWVLEGIQKL